MLKFKEYRVIIEAEKYPAFKGITIDNIKCTFEPESFILEIIDPNTQDIYALNMPKTREKYIPEKSKYYIRKDKIYIALHKEVRNLFCLVISLERTRLVDS
mgnify:FL=1